QAPPIGGINPDAPTELQRIVRKCLAKDPAERYQSIKDIAIDLRDLIKEYDSQPRVSGMYVPQPIGQGYQVVTAPNSAQVAITEAQTMVSGPSEAVTTGPVSAITEPTKAGGRRIEAIGGLLVGAGVIVIALYFFIGQKQSKISGPAFQNSAISKLTSTGRAQGAVISPDGKYVVHIVNEAGNQGLWGRQTR